MFQCNNHKRPPSIYEEGFSKQELEERRKWIEQFLRGARQGNDLIVFLMFGPEGSGKKTFIKQMKLLFGPPEISCIPDELKSQIKAETLSLLILMARTIIKKNVTLPDKSLQDLCVRLTNFEVDDLAKQIDDTFASSCHELWCSKEIGTIYDSIPSKFPSHAQYFVSHCKRIFARNYNPSMEDYLHFPEKGHQSIEEYDFISDGFRFRVINVNQRNERKKWIHQFETVTAVFFFADTTSCFRTISEDDKVIELEETLMLFDEMVNSKWFEYASMILFLTKRDLLADMILRAHADPSMLLKNYQSGPDFDYFMDYVKKAFLAAVRQYNKNIFTHYMVTTNTTNVQYIWNACKEITLHQCLDCAGLGESGFSSSSVPAAPSNGPSIGFAVGGAKDVVNFRKKIRSNQAPTLTDVTPEGIFYEYYFDTSGKVKSVESTKLFYPSYSSAVCKNPTTQETECYLSVGLNSSLKQADFKRKKLNVMIVLDMSGSMNSPFDREGFGYSKMHTANQSVISLLNHLNEGDSFGLLAFDDKVEQVCAQQPFDKIEDLSKLKEKIMLIKPRGGTDLHKAMSEGHKILSKYVSSKKEFSNRDTYENRMIFLTDAMPTVGYGSTDIAAYGLKMSQESIPIFTTYIGVGIDFNTQVVKEITKIPGANYFTVQSSSDLKKRLDDEFEFMVTPLVFDLKLSIQSNSFVIDKVIGSPEANMATGELMKVNTLFPSKRSEEGAKGGVILIKLKPKSKLSSINNNNENDAKEPQTDPITLTSSYQDRSGKIETETQQVVFDNLASLFAEQPQCYFDNTGIHKAIVLHHYVDFLHQWIQSNRFYLPPEQQQKFGKMIDYLTNSAEEVKDETILQETQILDVIMNSKPAPPSEPHRHNVQARKFWCICLECANKDQIKM